MRLHIVFASVVFILACINAVSAVSGTEKATVDTSPLTRLLTAGQNDKRLLRAKTTPEYDGTEDEERAISVGNAFEKAKFYYWRTMGKQPRDIYKKYFETMAPAKIAKSPKYKVWQKYEKWFNKAKQAQIIKNQQNALNARPT